MRQLLPAVVVASAFAAAACGHTEPRRVPNVTGLQLDAAEARLDARGLDSSVEGGGTFGVIVRSHWQVCEQVPRPGRKATEVTLVVERACSGVPAVRPNIVPDVEYETLPEAQVELREAGLGWEVEADGHVLVPSNWEVCDQVPSPGEWGDSVELYIEQDCLDW
jgi:beta-lactam-binding protein with PASTA domain